MTTPDYTVETQTHPLGGGYIAFTAEVTDTTTGECVYRTGRRENEEAAQQQGELAARRLSPPA